MKQASLYSSTDHRRKAAGGIARSFDAVGKVLTSADGEVTHHAYFRLPRHRLSDRLAFGASTDGCGRHGYSSCNTRWNAIAVSADSRRGSIEPRGLIGLSNKLGGSRRIIARQPELVRGAK